MLVELTNPGPEMNLCEAICCRRSIMTSWLSCCKFLYDSMTKAVRTAE